MDDTSGSPGTSPPSGATGPHANQPVAASGTPLGESPAAMILVHGRHGSPEGILAVARALERPQFTYLAPAASGNAWYPHSFLADRGANEPGLSSGLSVLRALTDQVLAAGVSRERLILLGFSQGACLAAEFAYRYPSRYGGVVVYSGGLIGPPGSTWQATGTLDHTPVFMGCSDIDAHIPKVRVDESAEVFREMGAEVTKRIYPRMGHLVNDDEIAFTRSLMDTLLEDG